MLTPNKFPYSTAFLIASLLLAFVTSGPSVTAQRRSGARANALSARPTPEDINAAGPFYISEILFNPSGTDNPNEYVEIRGTPNAVIPAGTYLLGIEGDSVASGQNPGDIQDIFDLSGKTIGSNGFLVLLQKTTPYTPAGGSSSFTNSGTGAGFGSGSTGSSIGHSADGSSSDIETVSVTFMLVQSTTVPLLTDDIDPDNNGIPDGSLYTQFVVEDSVGILDSGAGDIAYGSFNITNGSNGTVLTGNRYVDTFDAGYIGRRNSSTGSTAFDWYASASTAGTPGSTLTLSTSAASVFPDSAAGAPLNHVGSTNPNFTPTASVVSISGRVHTSGGAGITNARVTISGNSLPEAITVVTGRRGIFSFNALESGQTYVITVGSRRFTFSEPSQIVTTSDNVSQMNFVADP